MKESVIKSGSQVILIVFSVVLGLFLSERIEDRKNSQEAEWQVLFSTQQLFTL